MFFLICLKFKHDALPKIQELLKGTGRGWIRVDQNGFCLFERYEFDCSLFLFVVFVLYDISCLMFYDFCVVVFSDWFFCQVTALTLIIEFLWPKFPSFRTYKPAEKMAAYYCKLSARKWVLIVSTFWLPLCDHNYVIYHFYTNIIVPTPLVGGGGTIYSNGFFFVPWILADRYIHRREMCVVSLKSSSSVEFEIKKIFLNFDFFEELSRFKVSCEHWIFG